MCSLCARVHSGCTGRVVAGRFWCSYAWVSLTQTAPARPRGCLPACLRACVPVRACSCVCLCAPVCACVCTRVCVPVGGVLGVLWWCGGGVAPYLFSASVCAAVLRCGVARAGCAVGAGVGGVVVGASLFFSIPRCAVRWCAAVVCCAVCTRVLFCVVPVVLPV